MKKHYLLLLSILLLTSCRNEFSAIQNGHKGLFTGLKVDTLLINSISIRALLVDGNRIWYAADKGRYGYIGNNPDTVYNSRIHVDTTVPEFRSIAKTAHNIFVASVGDPGLIYSIPKDNFGIKLVYREDNEKVFYDSMQFWNDKEGIAMGDPTEGCLSVIITRDGGGTWKKLSCDQLPKTEEGEAAFAASNTNLIIKGNSTWMVSGGNRARVFYSGDKGNSWKVYDTPIVQGKAMTGIFTADFYDKNNGIIAGGDYEIPGQNSGNKAITTDGGKTWKLVADKQGFGYASCIQYVPLSKAKQIVAVGESGIYYSADSGVSWKQLSADKDLFTIRFINDSTAIAAGRNKIVRIRFKN